MMKMKKLCIISLFVAHSLNAEIIYYFTGNLSADWGTLTSGTPFSGSFSYEYPQTAHYYGGYGASYYFTNLTLNVGSESLLINQGYRSINTGVVPASPNAFNLDNGSGSFGITADDPTWTTNRPLLGGIPVGIVVEVTDNYWLTGGGASKPYLTSNALVGDWLRLEMFNFSRLTISDANQNSINIQSPLTSLVPEPSVLSLLAVGLGGLAMIRRRRS